MSAKDFQTYYKKPTKLETKALQIEEQLFCHQSCNQNCPTTCNSHPQARTLKPQYISVNNELTPRIPENPPPPQPEQPKPPPHIKNNPLKFPIQVILKHKTNETKDKYKITTKTNTYLCQWSTQNHTTYNQWLSQRDLFPTNQPVVIEHHTKLLK